MRKFRLEIETLAIESFTPGNEPAEIRGTVNAHVLATRTCPPSAAACEYTFSCPTGCTCTQ